MFDKILRLILQNLLSFTLFLSVMCNAALASALIYVILPTFDASFNGEKIIAKVDSFRNTVNADAILIWRVNLEQNSRQIFISEVKNPEDQERVDTFLDISAKEPFTKILNPDAVKALVSGSAYCEKAEETHPALATQDFRKEFPAGHICYFPIVNKLGTINGYMSLVWKERMPLEIEDMTVQHIINVMKQR